MATSVRSTIYLEPALHHALRLKAATAHRSMSDIVNDAVRAALREDEEDLAAFAERVREPSLSYEAFLAQLKADGTL
jgi:plasmid stability protein